MPQQLVSEAGPPRIWVYPCLRPGQCNEEMEIKKLQNCDLKRSV